MARLSARSGVVTLGGIAIKGVTACTIETANDPIDVTGMDSEGIVRKIAGLTNWSGSIEGFLDSAGYVSPEAVKPANAATTFSAVSGATAPYISLGGAVIIKGVSISLAVGDAAKFTIAVDGAGALTASLVAS